MSQLENNRYIVQVYVGALSALYEALSVEASKQTTSEEIVSCIVERLALNESPAGNYELAEVVGDTAGQECKERRLGPNESPVQLMMLWPKGSMACYRFYLREKLNEYLWTDNFTMDPQLIKDYFYRFLYQPKDREYPDLCQLPDLNERTLLENLRARFNAGHIYTYVGSILIAVNPFKFHPIYNPKYVKLYQNRRLGPNLPPHIFAVADSAYHCMLKERRNQCIVISGESGSGKTESTNFLLHHLTALSQKGSHGSGVEQTILSAGPVLEAFGNAKTAHNNNSSRFGKFIQVNYKENGMVHGAVVQKYLLEKSRICSQGRNERNYHVFYYLLAGASDQERIALHLKTTERYNYLNRSGCSLLDNVDETYEFSRLKQSMEMVGFTAEKQRRLFAVLSAVLLLGNVEFQPRKSAYHHDEAVAVKNPEVVQLISNLLRVKQETLLAALTAKRARASGETLIINYRLPEAIASRDAMAKCLYGALFDWIVLQVNHALLSKKDTLRDHQGNSIGVLDIFGFEDFGICNSFEQLCINYANEHLQYYFNQHVFKYEQEEYRREGIRWNNIDFMDNTGCLQLIEGKPSGLLCVLDDECSFPGATSETLLQKFNSVHRSNGFYEKPAKLEAAFMVIHYAGRVKYQVGEMREKNLDLMRQDIVSVLKNSSMAFVRELVGADPVAVFRWAIVRAFFRAYFAFHEAGSRHRQFRTDGGKSAQNRFKNHTPNETVISRRRGVAIGGRSWQRISDSALSGDSRDSGSQNTIGIGYDDFGRVLRPSEARVMQRANQIVMKNKSFRPRRDPKKGLKNLQTVKTLAGRTGLTGANQSLGKARKQPLTVAAQFQQSLHSLMDTLNQANPFFIRCIKSNGEKVPNQFDNETVQRQLRYTGMLETVRIRQAGFNVRLTYDEFIQHYRILLPKGLLSSQSDVRNFLATLNLNRDNYQLGGTKIFLRESEKAKLDCKLHQQIMASIVTIQRWFRASLERRRFLRQRQAVVVIQSFWRMHCAQKTLTESRNRAQAAGVAAIYIQAAWRGHCVRNRIKKLKKGIVLLQARVRGHKARRVFAQMLATRPPKPVVVAVRSPVKTVTQSNQEDVKNVSGMPDSDESSGLLEDVDGDSTHVRIRLGNYPTQSTVGVVPENVPTMRSYSTYQTLNRTEDPVVVDPGPQKRKLGKARRTIDLDLTDTVQFSSTTQRPLAELCSDNRVEIRKRDTKSELTKRDIRSTEGLYYLPPVRRDPRQNNTDLTGPQRARCVQATRIEIGPPGSPILPDNLASIDANGSSLPEVPIRTVRRPRRDMVCRSIGDTTTDGSSSAVDDVPLLSTVAEVSGTSPTDNSSRQVWRPRTTITQQEQDLPDFRQGMKQPSGRRLRSATTSDLRRRNSDPATAIAIDLQPQPQLAPGGDRRDWIDPTSFTYAGHRFNKVSRFSKDDRCVYCNEQMDAFVTQGHKCSLCKKLFHTKCIQNRRVLEMPCEMRSTTGADGKPRRKYRKHSQAPYDVNKQAVASRFSLTGTSEFTDRTDKIISDARELQLMQDFITNKICKMESLEKGLEKKPSEVDRVFKQALREFKDNLVATYSVVNKQGLESLNIKYKDLIANFLHVMETVCRQERKEEDFPVTMGVNAFRGFMNEFMTSRTEADKPSKTKRKKEKKRKTEDPISFGGHTFALTIINIPTACEICNSFFMWPIERGLVCQSCRLTCHKKCYSKVSASCWKESGHSHDSHKFFGVPLPQLLTGDSKIPPLLDRLITAIEMHGLYTEGIYRKSGVSSKVRELKLRMEEMDQEQLDFEDYQMHVLASVLKGFLRDMPEPLLTFDCYEDFLRAASLTDPQDRVSTLFDILRKLPKPNFDLMERLIFHLARVALHEHVNRMNASALAIVFAPCVLRTNKVLPAQDSLNDIGRQTQCIETIIMEQLRKVKSTLADIDTLDTACHTATHRLSSLRSSKVFSPEELQPTGRAQRPQHDTQPVEGVDEEAILVGHIQEIQKEKELLTSALPSLTRATSDDDMLSTDLDGEGSLDDVSCTGTPQSEPPPNPRRAKGPVVRSVSGGDHPRTNFPAKLKRQSSSDASTVQKAMEQCDDSPIMV